MADKRTTEFAQAIKRACPPIHERHCLWLAQVFLALLDRGIREKWAFGKLRLKAEDKWDSPLANKLAQLRRAAGLSYADLEKATGWSPSKISRMESGEVGVNRADMFFLIHQVYKLKDQGLIDWLMSQAGQRQH